MWPGSSFTSQNCLLYGYSGTLAASQTSYILGARSVFRSGICVTSYAAIVVMSSMSSDMTVRDFHQMYLGTQRSKWRREVHL